MSSEDRDLDEFVRAVCLAHPELRNGGLERLVEALQESMISIVLLSPLQEAAVKQHQVVEQLMAALRSMGQNASNVAWETTGAMIFAPGLLGTIGANVAGNALGGMVRRQIDQGEMAIAGPFKLMETLDAKYKESLDHARRSVDDWRKSIGQAAAVFQNLPAQAEAVLQKVDCTKPDSDPAFGAVEATVMLTNKIEEARVTLQASLSEGMSRCNDSALETMRRLSNSASQASAAGGVAIAGLLASLASSGSKAKEEEALRLARRADQRANPLYNPFWAHD